MAVYARLLKVSNCEKEMQAHSECIQPSKIKCCKKEHISTNCLAYSGRQTPEITSNLNYPFLLCYIVRIFHYRFNLVSFLETP